MESKGETIYVQGKLCMNNEQYEEMKKYFLEAIALGNSSAMNDLAFYYQYKEIDPNKVIQYYKMAIESGNVNSCYNLGCFYHEQGDIENKVKYLTLASEKGDERAHFGLGIYFEEAKKDKALSYKYYKLAANAGMAKAHVALGDYYKDQGKFLEAKNEYFTALRGGCIDANYCLDDRRLTVSDEERREIFTLVRKIYFPESQNQHINSVITTTTVTQ